MPSNYKDLFDELQEILTDMHVPRVLWRQSKKLNEFIANERFWCIKAHRAMEILHQIAPVPLEKFNLSERLLAAQRRFECQ